MAVKGPGVNAKKWPFSGEKRGLCLACDAASVVTIPATEKHEREKPDRLFFFFPRGSYDHAD